MGQSVVEKICQDHQVGPGSASTRPLRAGDFVALRPQHVLTHDNTAAVMKKFRAIGSTKMADPVQPVFALDHNIQDTSKGNLAKYREIASFAEAMGVAHYPAGRGIGHQVMIEEGYVTPGALVVASDSHANMYGALSALGTPVVRSDAAAIWATGEFWWVIPRTVQVVLEGSLRPGVTGKDVIITLCALYAEGEVLNAALEFTGPGVPTLSMDARLTIANMSTEWGALAAWFPCDPVTLAWLTERKAVLAAAGTPRFAGHDIGRWAGAPLRPDPDATYAGRITLDLSTVAPHVAGPNSVKRARSLAEIEQERVRVDKAYLVSCVNARVEDLEAAAEVLREEKVAPGVELYLAAASDEVERHASARGAWQALLEAGARPLPPGCGPCIGLGAGLLEPGETGISATNRNFEGRMGSRDAQCYLASPAVVAASARAGFITAPFAVDTGHQPYLFERLRHAASEGAPERVELVEGFPARLEARALYLPADHLDTDGIYGKDYTYREDMTPQLMAEVVMENYDPGFAALAMPGDAIVAGEGFGTGSSREQAATALIHKGIPLVVAASFSETFLRNAFNNGLPAIACAPLVAAINARHADARAAGERTIVVGGKLLVDFEAAEIEWRGERFSFAPLGPLPQALIVAGGLERQVRARLGLEPDASGRS